MNLQNLKLEYKGERDGDQVLWQLVVDGDEDIATYYALRSEMRDALAKNRNSTTLIEASGRGYLEVVKALLAAKADVDMADNEGQTPLNRALSHNHTEIVALLRAAGATE